MRDGRTVVFVSVFVIFSGPLWSQPVEFSSFRTYPVGGGGYSMVVADFNGDGKADAALGFEDRISVLLGSGDGRFSAPLTTAVLTKSLDLAAADFNSDGTLDLVRLNGGIQHYKGLSDGTFTLEATQLIDVGEEREMSRNQTGTPPRADLAVVVVAGYVELLLG